MTPRIGCPVTAEYGCVNAGIVYIIDEIWLAAPVGAQMKSALLVRMKPGFRSHMLLPDSFDTTVPSSFVSKIAATWGSSIEIISGFVFSSIETPSMVKELHEQ
eukprot:SAG31_NODE_99_length_25388_cov_12.710507_12_plen_103_part_00